MFWLCAALLEVGHMDETRTTVELEGLAIHAAKDRVALFTRFLDVPVDEIHTS